MDENLIDYREIEIESPYEIIRIVRLEIINEPNEHGKLKYTAIIEEEKEDEYVVKSKYKDKIKVKQNKEGEFVRDLFVGEPVSIEVSVLNNTRYLTVEALSYTYEMDIEKKKRSYQNKDMTYDGLIESIIKGYNKPDYINTVAKGELLKIFTLEYLESDWEFLKRLCSRYGSVLVAESRQDSPKFWFGLPEGESYELKKTDYKIRKKLEPYKISKERYKASVKENDFVTFEIESSLYMYIGDNVTINEIKTKVSKCILKMEDGVLIMNYTLMPKRGIRQDLITNDKINGLNIEGTVIGRKGNKIKIKLDIDRNNPDCGERWFKYESGYTVGENFGWYVMPEEGHFVSLHMPTNLEEEAYSIRSVRRDGDSNARTSHPIEKILSTEHYKEIRMDNDQLKIITKDDKTGKMYIQMKHEDGIKIESDKDIKIESKTDINWQAKSIKMNSDSGIYFLNNRGSIILDGDTDFYNTKIDIKATGEEDIKLMCSKKAEIIKSIENIKNIGVKGADTKETVMTEDPVDVATGNFYIEQIDIIIKGAKPLYFKRFYNALDDYRGVLGESWHHIYELKLKHIGNKISVIHNDGRLEEFIEENGVIRSESDATQVIERGEENRYILKIYNGTKYTFNEEGLLINVENKESGEIKLSYEKEMLVKIENKSGYIELKYQRDKLVNVTDVVNRRVEYKYDNNALIKVRNINGGYTEYEYDIDFQMVKVIDPNGNEMVRNVYDQEGRVIRQTMADGSREHLEYDDENKITTVTNRNGIPAIYKRDEKNRVIEREYINGVEKVSFDITGSIKEVTDKNGNVYKYEYGKKFKVTNPLGEVKEVTYNGKGEIIEEKFPDGNAQSFEYDEEGNVISATDQRGNVTNLIYDKENNLIKIELPDESTRTFEYENANIKSIEDGEGNKTLLEYDKVNRVIGITKPKGNKTTYEYNEIDKITGIKYANSTSIKKSYDYCGFITEEIDEAGGISKYEYNKIGKLCKYTDSLGYVTTYEYDCMWNIIKKVNPDGSEKLYKYNKANLLTAEVDEEGEIKYYHYDSNGNVIKETDEKGNATKYEYDGINRIIGITNANYGEIKTEYRYDNKVIKKVNEMGGEITNEYDECGNLISSTNEIGAKVLYEYNELNYVTKEVNPYGKETEYEYNKMGKVKKVINADGTIEEMSYDENGNLIKHIDKGGEETTYEYDLMDRVCVTTDALGGRKEIKYNTIGKISLIKDENGNETKYNYDLKGNLEEVINAKGYSTKYKYNYMGKLTEVHQLEENKEENVEVIKTSSYTIRKPKAENKEENNAEIKGIVTEYKYNKKGLLVQEIDAKRQITFYKYDECGNLISKEDREGYITQYEYDVLNNITKIKYGDERTVEYKYDGLSRVISMLDWLGETSYERDILGRIKKVKDYKGEEVRYEWGLMNEKEKIKYPDGSETIYEYDINRRIKKVINGKEEIEYEYNPIGTISKEILPMGMTTEYSYDKLHRMTKLTHYGKNKEILDERTYEYDLKGNKIKGKVITNEKIRNWDKNYEEEGVTTYEYDSLNQLVKVKNNNGCHETYEYSELGNRIKKTEIKENSSIQVEYVYDELNRLIKVKGKDEELLGYKLKDEAEIQYDARGNMVLIKSSSGENIGEYIYDSTNRLIRTTTNNGTVASYQYSGLGQRVKKEIDNKVSEYVIDVTTQYNDILMVNEEKYIYGSKYAATNKLICSKQGKDLVKVYLHDNKGSVIRTISETGETGEIKHYNAFGKAIEFKRPMVKEEGIKGFTGYERDKGTGLEFVQARYYMSDIGRFVEEDTNKGEIHNQASLNWYIHCYNNPLIYVDLDGHKAYVVEWSLDNSSYAEPGSRLYTLYITERHVDAIETLIDFFPGFGLLFSEGFSFLGYDEIDVRSTLPGFLAKIDNALNNDLISIPTNVVNNTNDFLDISKLLGKDIASNLGKAGKVIKVGGKIFGGIGKVMTGVEIVKFAIGEEQAIAQIIYKNYARYFKSTKPEYLKDKYAYAFTEIKALIDAGQLNIQRGWLGDVQYDWLGNLKGYSFKCEESRQDIINGLFAIDLMNNEQHKLIKSMYGYEKDLKELVNELD